MPLRMTQSPSSRSQVQRRPLAFTILSHKCAMSSHHNLKNEEKEEKPKQLHLHVEDLPLRSFTVISVPDRLAPTSWSEVAGLRARPHLTHPHIVAI